MNNQNDKFSTTIYVNSEQCSERQFDQQFEQQFDHQFKHQYEHQFDHQHEHQFDHTSFNNPFNQPFNENDQQVNDLYQNVGRMNKENSSPIASNDRNSNNSLPVRIPPPIKPRLSLLTKQRVKQPKSASCEALEQIDENLNLILKRHNEKLNEIDALETEINEIEEINVERPSAAGKLLTENSSQETIYLNDESLRPNIRFNEIDDLTDECNVDATDQATNQFSQTDKLLSKISALNRNTYISNSDVNEDTIRRFNLNNKFSSDYNELEEPIYSDIIFDDRPTSIYDTPSLTDSIRFLRPPPLPPRPANQQSPVHIETDENEMTTTVEPVHGDTTRNDLKTDLKSDLRTELTNELRNVQFRNVDFKHSYNSLNNSSSLNSSLNNAPIRSNQATNPFVTQPHHSSDLKLNELKESLNVLRKDHLLSLSGSLKGSLNKDELLMFDNCLDPRVTNTSIVQAKRNKVLPQTVSTNNRCFH